MDVVERAVPQTKHKGPERKKSKKFKIFGDGPGCFGGYWGVIPEYCYGFSKDFEKLDFQKLKIYLNRFKIC